ncbi:MAG: TonB-dependent receptor domain-containing protein [Halothiobacillaceae bacterium]
MNRRTTLPALCALTSAILAATAGAETLAPITVTGSFEQGLPEVERITAFSPIQGPQADSGEALRLIPGVSGSRMGRHGVDPIIRGQSADQINVLIDGGLVNGACPNRMDPPTSFASLLLFDRVVVEKGVHSLTEAAGGSGGTVRFERDTAARALAEPGMTGRATLGANANGLNHELSADLLMAGKHAYVRLQAESVDADNYEDGDGKEVPSSVTKRTGTLVGGYQWDADNGMEATITRARATDARYAGSGMDAPKDELTDWRLKGWAAPGLGWAERIRAEAWHADVDHVMDNFSLRKPPADRMMYSRSPTSAKTQGARLVATASFERFQVDYGVEFNRVERNALVEHPFSGNLKFRTWPEARQQRIGLFAQTDLAVGADGLLRGALRADRHESRMNADLPGPSIANNTAPWVPEGTRAAARQTRNDWGVEALLRYEHMLGGGWTAFTGASRTVRVADATERYFFHPGLKRVGNPSLDTEVHYQLDAGIMGQLDRSLLEFSAFVDRVDDYILRERIGAVQTYRNVDALLYGAELSATHELADTWQLTGGLAWVRGRVPSEHRNLPQLPPINGQLGLEYAPGPWMAGARIRFSDRQSHIDLQSGLDTRETGAWGVLDLYARYRFSAHFSARAGVDNLFDRTYAEHVNRAYSGMFGDPADRVNEPGRTVWARIDAQF